jgi:hypothetical protein
MRIIKIYAYICYMKTRVNLTISPEVLEKAKKYAAKKGSSVSELVESFLEKVTYSKKSETKLFEMVAKLKKPDLPKDFDYKKEYYEAKGKKYGL